MCHLQERIPHPKTSMLAALLGSWGIGKEQCVLLIVEELTSSLVLASRNLPGVILTTADRLVISEILRAESIIIEAGALAYIQVCRTLTKCSRNCVLADITMRY